MTFNPILKELGFSSKDKVIIIHADDVGINHSSIDAYEELMDFGTISCGSAMVPTSWFPEVVKRYKEHPEWDLGLHLAFNGEYETYKWRPLSTSDAASGFIDENGYFIQDKATVQKTADPYFIKEEIKAQIDLSLSLGLHPTHVDSHTGTLFNKKYIDSYAEIYDEYGIYPVLFKADENNPLIDSLTQGGQFGIDKINELERRQFPLLDGITGVPVEHTYELEDRLELTKNILSSIESGKLVHFAFHPIKDSDETHALNRYVGGRVGDYEVFRTKKLKTYLQQEGFNLIGYKEVNDAISRMKLETLSKGV